MPKASTSLTDMMNTQRTLNRLVQQQSLSKAATRSADYSKDNGLIQECWCSLVFGIAASREPFPQRFQLTSRISCRARGVR